MMMTECCCCPLDPYFLRLEDYDAWICGSRFNFLSSSSSSSSSSLDDQEDVHELGKPFLSSFSFSHLRNFKNKWRVEERETIVFEETEAEDDPTKETKKDELMKNHPAEDTKSNKKKTKMRSVWKRLKHTTRTISPKSSSSSSNNNNKHCKKKKKQKKNKNVSFDFQDKMAKRLGERMHKEMASSKKSKETYHKGPEDPIIGHAKKLKSKKRSLLQKLLSCGIPSSSSKKARAKQKPKRHHRNKKTESVAVDSNSDTTSRLGDCAATAASTDVGSPPPSPSGLSLVSYASMESSTRLDPIHPYPTPYPYDDKDDPPSSPAISLSSYLASARKPKKKMFDYRRSTPKKKSKEASSQSRNTVNSNNPVAAILASFERFAKTRDRPKKRVVKRLLKKLKERRFPMLVFLGLALFQSMLTGGSNSLSLQSMLTGGSNSLSLLGGVATGIMSNPSLGCFMQGLTSAMMGGLSASSAAQSQLMYSN
jgi:hypothetical protein